MTQFLLKSITSKAKRLWLYLVKSFTQEIDYYNKSKKRLEISQSCEIIFTKKNFQMTQFLVKKQPENKISREIEQGKKLKL